MSATELLLAAAARATSEEELLRGLSDALRRELDADSVELYMRQSDGVLAAAGTPRVQIGVGPVGEAAMSREPLLISKHLLERPDYDGASHFESGLFVPMSRGETPLGVIAIRRVSEWTGQTERAEELAQITALTIAIWRRAFESGGQTNRMDALSEVTKRIAGSPYLEEILQLLVNLTAQQFNYKVVTVRLLDETKQELILRATQATHRAYQRKRAIRLGESIAGKALEQKRPILVKNVQTDKDYIGHDLAEEQGLKSMVCVPLTIFDRAVGVMSCYTGEEREFHDDEIAALETLAKQAAISIENAKLQVRNTLMQEMHHRVKNNLQQIVSLMRLQLGQEGYRSLEQGINDTLARVQAIAAVHDLLSREDLDHVDIKSIAETIVQHQQQAFILPGKRIRFDVRGDDVYLNLNQATQISLILNELIQNAVEHGFARANEGEVHIAVEDNDGEIGVWVSNDGDTLPPGFSADQGGLGLQIVRSLAGALGGEFTIRDSHGWTVCAVEFARTQAE